MSQSETRRIHIQAWQVSGMSQVAYCRGSIMVSNARTFAGWLSAYRTKQSIQFPAMVPVTIKPMPMSVDTLRLRGQGNHVL